MSAPDAKSSGYVLLKCSACSSVNRVPAARLMEGPICGKCKRELKYPSSPLNGSADNFRGEVIDSPGFVLVIFSAVWCGACRMMEPVVERLASRYAGHIKVVKIDVDKVPAIASSHGIHATPTSVLYLNGSVINRIEGAVTMEQLEGWLKNAGLS